MSTDYMNDDNGKDEKRKNSFKSVLAKSYGKNIKNKNKVDRGDILAKSNEQCTVIIYLLLIIIFTTFVYLIRPLNIILAIFFLFKIVYLKENTLTEDATDLSNLTDPPYPIVGIVIIFGMPLLYLFVPGIKIICVQETKMQKVVVVFNLLIESILEIPVPFFYDNNTFSLFLFDEEGPEKLLAPWLIFYPTNHILNIYEILKNLFFTFYFCVTVLVKIGEIQNNLYNESVINFCYILFTISFLTFLNIGVIFLLKIIVSIHYTCAKKNNKKEKVESIVFTSAKENQEVINEESEGTNEEKSENNISQNKEITEYK